MTTSFGLDRYRVERRDIANNDVTIILDMPPSTNNLFFNVQGKGRVATKEYRDWKDRNSGFIKSQKPSRVSGPVEIRIQVEDNFPRRDIDNPVKPCLDLIADRGMKIIDGDHANVVRKVTAEWADVKGVKLTISRAKARAA